MKRFLVVLLSVAMAFTCIGCGKKENKDNKDKTENQENNVSSVKIKDATEILTNTWVEYNNAVSEELKFPVGGGNIENFELVVMDTAGKCDTSLEGAKDTLTASFCIPTEAIEMTDDVATMMNMMMANNFSSAAYHIADKANVEKVVADIKDATLNNPWLCGFPEKLIVVTVNGDYVVSAFGNGQVIDAFKTAITTVYDDAAVVSVEENLAQ